MATGVAVEIAHDAFDLMHDALDVAISWATAIVRGGRMPRRVPRRGTGAGKPGHDNFAGRAERVIFSRSVSKVGLTSEFQGHHPRTISESR